MNFLSALVTVAVLAAAPDSLRQAAQSLDDLQYDTALKQLPPETEVKGYSREELVSYFSTRALAQLGLKKDAEAAESFRRLFTFAPEWKLPDQYGPKVVTFVAGLRAEADERGTPTLKLENGVLKATWDSTGLAKELQVFWKTKGAAPKSATLPLAAQQAPPWPRDQQLEAWGRVVGLEGSTLAEWSNEHAPTVVQPAFVQAPPPPAAAPGKPLGTFGLIGIGAAAAGLVAGGIGTGFALGSQDAQKALAGAMRDSEGRITSLTQRDAFALDARVTGDAGAATGLFVTGGVLLAAGVGLFVFDRVSIAPTPGGALLTVPLDAHFGLAAAEVQR